MVTSRRNTKMPKSEPCIQVLLILTEYVRNKTSSLGISRHSKTKLSVVKFAVLILKKKSEVNSTFGSLYAICIMICPHISMSGCW